MTAVSVVILNYNGEKYLKDFLPLTIKHSEDAEIIVVDNASTDNSIDVLTEFKPNVRVIQLPVNLGYAGAYNEVIHTLDTKYSVLLNSDIEVTANWLSPVVALMEADNSVDACQPKILDYSHKDRFEYAGACGGFIDLLGYPFCRGRIFNTTEVDHGQYDQPREIFWASGACFFVRTNTFKELGGLDDHFFAHMEEIDLCWRIHRNEGKVMVSTDSVVYHVGGGTLPVTNPLKTYLNFKNNLEMLVKNLPGIQLIWKLPSRIILDWVAILKFLFEGSGKHSIAVIKAHLHFIVRVPQLIKRRKGPFAVPSGIIYRNPIVAQYYLLGNRTFDGIDW